MTQSIHLLPQSQQRMPQSAKQRNQGLHQCIIDPMKIFIIPSSIGQLITHITCSNLLVNSSYNSLVTSNYGLNNELQGPCTTPKYFRAALLPSCIKFTFFIALHRYSTQVIDQTVLPSSNCNLLTLAPRYISDGSKPSFG